MAVHYEQPGAEPGFKITWASMPETLTLLLANNKVTDHTAHPRRLISALIIRYQKSKVPRSDISLFSSFFLVGFNMIRPLAKPLTVFNKSRPLLIIYSHRLIR